jgi:hypothetical protein
MSYISYQSINSLEEVAFIAGTNYTLSFTVTDEYGAPINIEAATCTWVLSPYGQPDILSLSKEGDIKSASVFDVVLDAEDTLTFSGKYMQQPIVEDFSGNIFRPAQGVVTIIPAIATS